MAMEVSRLLVVAMVIRDNIMVVELREGAPMIYFIRSEIHDVCVQIPASSVPVPV
jgi:hypothetical protein